MGCGFKNLIVVQNHRSSAAHVKKFRTILKGLGVPVGPNVHKLAKYQKQGLRKNFEFCVRFSIFWSMFLF